MDVQEAIDLLTYDLISQDTHCPNEVSYKFWLRAYELQEGLIIHNRRQSEINKVITLESKSGRASRLCITNIMKSTWLRRWRQSHCEMHQEFNSLVFPRDTPFLLQREYWLIVCVRYSFCHSITLTDSYRWEHNILKHPVKYWQTEHRDNCFRVQ
jgi:hypothetical protein